MSVDAHKNLAYSTCATPPSGTSGTSLVVATGTGTRFPAVPFNATIWPNGVSPLPTNAEIVRVTNIASDTFTIVRAQEGTSARTFSNNCQIAATVTAKTLTDVERQSAGHYNPLYYGAVGDGTTDDAVALDACIDDCLADGKALYVPFGYTFKCASWSTITCDAELRIFGGGTIKLASAATQASFLTCRANFVLENVTFDGWYRVISNPTGTTGSLTKCHALRCTFKNAADADTISSNLAYQLLLQNSSVQNVRIEGCHFENCLYTAFQVGDNTYSDQDDWRSIVVRGNKIDGVSMSGSTAAIAYGFLIYGRDVLIEGNEVCNVDGPTAAGASASNGASGIYTKARYNQIKNNRLYNIGNAVNASVVDSIVGIHIKGSDRSASDSPQGFDVVCEGNTVLNVGVSNTRGYGIAALHSDVLIRGNLVEETGRKGILLADTVTGALGSVVISDNTVLHASGASYCGIDVVNAAASMVKVANNIINCPNDCIKVRTVSWHIANVSVTGNITKVGIAIHVAAESYNVSNLLIANNLMHTGTYGVYFATSGGGVISDVMVCDNDFSVASTAGISGTAGAIPATARIRNNRGYVSENGGTSAGKTTGQTIAHGLAAAPTVFSAVPQAAATDVYVTADATNLTVNFGGGGTVAFAWEAKIASHYA